MIDRTTTGGPAWVANSTELERRALELLGAAPALISIHEGPEHTCVFVNEMFHRMLGSERRIVGVPLRQAIPELADQGIFERFDRAFTTGEPIVVEEMPARVFPQDEPEPEIRHFKQVLQPWHSEGEVRGVISCAIEVTEQVQQRRRLEMEERERETFISILGHDLRNPLNLVKVVVSHLLESEELPPSFAKPLGRVMRAGDRMGKLIDDMLDFARGRFGFGMHLEPVEIDLCDVCVQVVSELEALTSEEIVVSCEGRGLGCWDRDRAAQAISNIVSNAIQHGKGPIQVRTRAREDEVVIEVENAGEPIPPERLARIFDPFSETVYSSSGGPGGRQRAGLGLGLYITREIMLAHGGSIEARSSAEESTVFTMRWPRR